MDKTHRLHRALEIARIGEQVEGDQRLRAGIAALEPDEPFREGLVGPELNSAKLEAHPGPGEAVRDRELHVLCGAVGMARAEAHAEQEVVAETRGQPALGLDVKPDANQRMLLQIGPDARPIRHNGNAVLAQVLRGADAGAHEERRRMERAARDDDLAARDALAPAIARNLHGDCALALELNALDETLWQDAEVLTKPRRAVEIGQCRGDAVTVDVVLGKRKAAVAELGMAIVEIGDALLRESVAESEGESAPVTGEGAMDRDRPLLAVVRAVEIEIALQLAQEGQTVPVGPTLGPQGLPFIVIGGQAADGDLAVDRRAAAHDPRLLVAPRPHERRDFRERMVPDGVHVCLEGGPVVILLEVMRQEGQRIDLIGDVLGRRVDAGLEKRDGDLRVGRQPVGQHAACRAAANDDIVADRHSFVLSNRAPGTL